MPRSPARACMRRLVTGPTRLGAMTRAPRPPARPGAAVARESRLDGRRVGQRDDDGAGPRSEVARRGGRRCAESDDLLHALGRDVVDDHVAVLAHEMPRVQAPDDPQAELPDRLRRHLKPSCDPPHRPGCSVGAAPTSGAPTRGIAVAVGSGPRGRGAVYASAAAFGPSVSWNRARYGP